MFQKNSNMVLGKNLKQFALDQTVHYIYKQKQMQYGIC